jgi:hypothetical protein
MTTSLPKQDYVRPFSEIEGADSVDAANDCYAAWKVFQMLESFRLVKGVKMPALIDYGDSLVKKNRKRRRQLLESMRIVRGEGGRCMSMLNELINLKKARLNMKVDVD